MDARTIRTNKIRAWVAEVGGPAEFATKYGGARWVAAQVSQWTSLTNPKGIGHALARDIERALGKPTGAMDREDESGSTLASHPLRIEPEKLRLSIVLIQRVGDTLGVEYALDVDAAPLAAAYTYLLAKNARSVTSDDVVDFIKILNVRERSDGRKAGIREPSRGVVEGGRAQKVRRKA